MIAENAGIGRIKLMSSDSLSFTLVGTERDGEAVTLKDFSSFIDRFTTCLRRVEERTAGKVALRHLIDDLRTGSATLTIRPVSPPDAPGRGRDVYGTFRETVAALETGGQIDPRFTNDDLKAFRELAAPIWNRQKRVEVAGVELTTRYVSNIDALLRGETKSKGSVKGRIEKLNVHETHEFTLFPPIGEYSVRCIFPDELFETVYKAVRRTITVTGTLYFKRDNPYPDRVQVDTVEIHPADSDLPTGTSLRGLIPDALGGKSAVEFIQALRDEQ
jgi:hypothetical protein